MSFVVACGGAVVAPQAKEPVVREPTPPVVTVPGAFWEETPLPNVTLPPVSYEKEKLVRAELIERFESLAQQPREKLVERGVLVAARADPMSSIGDAYVALAKGRVPIVITLDALFAITFRAIDRALDDVDREVVGPALASALAETEDRLRAENHAARSDTAPAYTLARAVIAIARKLTDPKIEIERAIADAIAPELALILAHAGPAKSPLLGRTIDYGAFDTQAGLAFSEAHIAEFRAVTWLARAPLSLSTEASARGLDVAMVRTQTRAAMLLSRATSAFWKRVKDAIAFATGRGDDPGARALLVAANAIGIDLRDEATIGNVVRVDKLRAEMLHEAGTTIEDTGGSLATFRLLSPSSPPDVRALARVMKSTRELPTALDALLALGDADARALLEEKHVEATTLDEVVAMFSADQETRHASIHSSALDAIATYVAPSSFDARRPWREGAAYKRRKLEVALSAWTTLRHATMPFARRPARAVLDEPTVSFEGASAIEPHPEAIARLVSLVHQTQRGALVREASASSQLLERVEALLKSALAIVTAQASAPLSPAIAHDLSTIPSRIAAIERRLGPAADPLVVATASDVDSGRVLEQGTGYIEDAWLAIDVAGTTTLYVGVAIPFYESAATLRSTDASFAKRLIENPPAKPTWLDQ